MTAYETPDFENEGFTVRSRFKARKKLYTKKAAWLVGKLCQKLWTKQTGEEVRKTLKKKTNGPGSHCIADYPATFVPEMDAIIDRVCTELDRQLTLFNTEPDIELEDDLEISDQSGDDELDRLLDEL